MNDLSPAAQAVLIAFNDAPFDEEYGDSYGIAAALRAAVDQVVPLYSCNTSATRGRIRHKLLAIAAELEDVDG